MPDLAIRIACWLIAIAIVAPPPTAVGQSESLRIATYNINWANVDLPAIAKTIRGSNADIVCLQETNKQSEKFLVRAFGQEFPYALSVGYRRQYGAERFGILSKHPVSRLRFDPPRHGLFGTWYVDVQFQKQTIHVVNVHLTPFIVGRGSSIPQVFSALSQTEVVHQKEIQDIVKSINPDEPTLVMGDFNSVSTLAAPQALTKQGLTDSYAAVTDSPDSHPTWHWPLRVGQIQLRIDYIFHTRHFTTKSSRIIPSKGSDHYLLVSELQIAADTPEQLPDKTKPD